MVGILGSEVALAVPTREPANESGKSSEPKIYKPEEDDYAGTPFTEYGEFNEAPDEEADTRFFQYGRFFGVSLGLGFEFVDGYRGALWQGGFPLIDFKLHYWFDFNLAIDLGFFTVSHYYNTTAQSLGYVSVNVLRIGVDVKYYFNTKNLSAAVSFANPYILLGAGGFSKTENSIAQQTQDVSNSLGISFGAGLEFAITPRKIYFEIEGKAHLVPYVDAYTTNFQTVNLPNLTGNFYTFSGNFLFTW